MPGTTSPTRYVTPTQQKALCFPQLLQIWEWIHFSWWRFDDRQERTVSGQMKNSDTGYFVSMCHIYKLKKRLSWASFAHIIHVDVKPRREEGFLAHGTKVEIDILYSFIVQ